MKDQIETVPYADEYLDELDYLGGYNYDLGVPAYGYSWGGYKFEPPLSERYIDQVASGLAHDHKVKITRGDSWGLDLIGKKLEYDPQTLRHGTKANVMWTLLHEIGHLRHSTHFSKLKSPFLAKYPHGVKQVLNVFEDFRVDDRMMEAYPGAEGLYEFNGAAMRAEGDVKYQAASREREAMLSKLYQGKEEHKEDKEKVKKIEDAIKQINEPSLLEYCGEMCLRGYKQKALSHFNLAGDKIRKLADDTEWVIKPGIKCQNTQELLALLDKEVLPKIEDLLKEHEQLEKTREKLTKQLAAVAATLVSILRKLREGSDGEKGIPMEMARGRGPAEDSEPEESFDSYEAVRQSVYEHIRKLAREINRIRTMEERIEMDKRQRSGKVDIRRLYKARLDEPRLFKRMKPIERRLNSMAFSLIVDRSGSMKGSSAVASTKCTVLLNEVAKICKIPIEVLAFDNRSHILKTFDGQVKPPAVETGIMKWIYYPNGGNYIEGAIEASLLPKQPKRHKFMFLITDGGEPDIDRTRKWVQSYMVKHHITPYFLGIHCKGYEYVDPPFMVNIDKVDEMVNKLSSGLRKVVNGSLTFS